MSSYEIDGALWSRVRNAIAFLLLIGVAASVAGAVTEPERFYRSYLVGFLHPTSILLGALFFVMVMHITGSVWSITVRRFHENLIGALPLVAVALVPVVLGIHHLYEWSHAEEVAHDTLLRGKAAWLNPQGFTIRAFIYVAIWSFFALRLVHHSTAQDSTRSIDNTRSLKKYAAPGLFLGFISVSLASFDWVMSLAPHWYSTMFGVYFYAGGGWASFATLVLICLAFRSAGMLRREINVEHYHDLGKWMFALTVFWTYIAFCQYLLIWYANLPEETIWFRNRFVGGWAPMSVALLFGHFFIPFLVLLPRASKRNLKLLRAAALWFLAMHYLDLYWMVMPTFYKDGPSFHWLDLAPLVAVGSLYALGFWMRLKKHAIMAVGDLRLEQALEHHNL